MKQIFFYHIFGLQPFWSSDLNNPMNTPSNSPVVSEEKMFGLNIFYLYTLYTLYIEQHINTYNNIQYTNGIQKKVFRLIRILYENRCLDRYVAVQMSGLG